jgi:hypothetical protein
VAGSVVGSDRPTILRFLNDLHENGERQRHPPSGLKASVSCTGRLLGQIAPDIEKELKPRLQGLIGSFVRAYLPQVWVFETEKESTTVRIEPTGAVKVTPGTSASPDVTVQAPHDRLEKLLTSRSRPATMPPDVRVIPHTAKGRAAFDQVRSRFGL